MSAELTTVAPDEAVFFDGVDPIAFTGLEPDTDYDIDGLSFRTLRQPGGELLSTIATVNDVHFGETECGVIEGTDIGPTYRVGEGETPYPETMNRAAIAEIVGLDADLVVVKGDLTANGTGEELRAFEDAYVGAFGDRLVWVRGNHESYHHVRYASDPLQVRRVPGAQVVLLDTSVDGTAGGALTVQQLDELDAIGADSDVPVLVMGHHHCWSPTSTSRPEGHYFGIQPQWSERLVEVFARRPRLVGYFAGHTHRNRVRRFAATGDVPFAEVSCVKDHPGAWAEYRVFEGGVVQVFRRISAPDALAWSELTRDMYGGTYHDLCFGSVEERCFVFAEV